MQQQQQSWVSSRWRETPSSLSLLPPSESNCVTLHSTSLCLTALRGNLMPCCVLHCIVGHVSRWEQPPTAAAATAMEGISDKSDHLHPHLNPRSSLPDDILTCSVSRHIFELLTYRTIKAHFELAGHILASGSETKSFQTGHSCSVGTA